MSRQVELVLASKDHYETLNSHRGATPHELKARYKRMALLLHPDKNPEEVAAVAFKRVTDAWESLGLALPRAEYDAQLDGGTASTEDAEDAGNSEAGGVRAGRGDASAPQGPPGLKKRRARPNARRR